MELKNNNLDVDSNRGYCIVGKHKSHVYAVRALCNLISRVHKEKKIGRSAETLRKKAIRALLHVILHQ